MSPVDLQPGEVSLTIQRHITDEETVCFVGRYPSTADAEAAATSQLAVCRSHMIAYNERVRAVDEAKRLELEAAIQTKGDEVKRLNAQIAEAEAKLGKLGKRLASVG